MIELDTDIQRYCAQHPATMEYRQGLVIGASLDNHVRTLELTRDNDIDYRLGSTTLSVVSYYTRLFDYNNAPGRENQVALSYIPLSAEARRAGATASNKSSPESRFAQARRCATPQEAIWGGVSQEHEVLRSLHKLYSQTPTEKPEFKSEVRTESTIVSAISRAVVAKAAVPHQDELKNLARYRQEYNLTTFLDYLVHARKQFAAVTEQIFTDRRIPTVQ